MSKAIHDHSKLRWEKRSFVCRPSAHDIVDRPIFIEFDWATFAAVLIRSNSSSFLDRQFRQECETPGIWGRFISSFDRGLGQAPATDAF